MRAAADPLPGQIREPLDSLDRRIPPESEVAVAGQVPPGSDPVYVLHRIRYALAPRKVSGESGAQADYLVTIGESPPAPAARLLYRNDAVSLWKLR